MTANSGRAPRLLVLSGLALVAFCGCGDRDGAAKSPESPPPVAARAPLDSSGPLGSERRPGDALLQATPATNPSPPPGQVTLTRTEGGWRLVAHSAPRHEVLEILARELGFDAEGARSIGGIANLDVTAASPEALIAATIDDRPFRLLYAPDPEGGGTRLAGIEAVGDTDDTAANDSPRAQRLAADKPQREHASPDSRHESTAKPGARARAPRPPPPAPRDPVERALALEVRAEKVAAREQDNLARLESDRAEERVWAARQLDPEDPNASSLLELMVVDDPDASVRAMAARQLAFSDEEGAARALERALDDPASPVVVEALGALERSRRLPDRTRLQQLAGHSDGSVAARARELLDDLD